MRLWDKEQRQAVRKKTADNKVFVKYRCKKIGTYITKDISSRGVFLKSDTTPIPLGAVVELIFTVVQDNITKVFRKRAILTRITSEGYGAGFIRSVKKQKGI